MVKAKDASYDDKVILGYITMDIASNGGHLEANKGKVPLDDGNNNKNNIKPIHTQVSSNKAAFIICRI